MKKHEYRCGFLFKLQLSITSSAIALKPELANDLASFKKCVLLPAMDSIEKTFDDDPDDGFLQVGNPFSVESTSFKKAPARSFASAAFKANEKGWKCTIELQREPTNKKNQYAVKVFGIAEAKLFGISNIKTWHIGYLPEKISWGIACDVPPARQINAQLNQVDRSSKGDVLVTMTLLVGPIITEN